MTLNANQRLFGKLALVAVGMFAFGYALVPFYYQICAAWGVNSLGELRAEWAAVVLSQTTPAKETTMWFPSLFRALKSNPSATHFLRSPGRPPTPPLRVEALEE